MKKRVKGKVISRQKDQREALLNTLMTGLILNKKIKTSLAKAKLLKPYVEKITSKSIKLVKKDQHFAIRYLKKHLSLMAIREYFNIVKVNQDRTGGHVRILKLGKRNSDAAEMAIIEWTDADKLKEDKAKDKRQEKKEISQKKENNKDADKKKVKK